jgi:hypothetical protein
VVWTTRSWSPAASAGDANATPNAAGDRGPTRVDVDERHPSAGYARRHLGHAAPDHARTDHADPVADQGRGVPEGVDGGLDGACQDRPLGRHAVRHRNHGRGGHDVARLVRVQAEHDPPFEVARALLDDADVEVPVLHRSREVALLERRPHPGVLVRGDLAAEHESLGPAADA